KRTKTYVGCWTCRSRGVKCDASRPACNRCTRLDRLCEGYEIRLVWDDVTGRGDNAGREPQNAKQKRRLMLDDADMRNPIFDETYLSAILKRLDSPRVDDSMELVEGPYTVFACAPTIEGSDSRLQFDITSSSEADSTSAQDSCSTSPGDPFEPEACYPTSKHLWSRFLLPFLSVSSAEERQLLRFWVTSASGLMISTNHPNNPFREVVIPLVLESAASAHRLPGHSALLHSIYAFAAFNRSQLQEPPGEHDEAIAAKHHQAGLRYLRQSMMEDSRGQHEAILASMILMTSIDIVAARSCQWRNYIRGGRDWLRSLRGKWNESQGGLILRQLFHCVEIIGYSHDHSTQFAASSSSFFEEDWEMDTMSSATPGSPTNEYCLEKLYGITKPVLRAIFDVSRLSMSAHRPTSEDLVALRNTLLLANPSTARFPSPKPELEKVTRHHACSWYYACMIHYERSLHHSPPREIQHLVEQCLYHLEAVEDLHDNSAMDGLMWPLYVTACEAEDDELRRRCMQVFAKKANRGVGATACVEGLILEIWHRRDMNPEEDVLQQQVAEDLKIDILLT
ncbi:uncharacterized protein BDZ99DRAFT_351133, partial [Mytilinidion resinicola]